MFEKQPWHKHFMNNMKHNITSSGWHFLSKAIFSWDSIQLSSWGLMVLCRFKGFFDMGKSSEQGVLNFHGNMTSWIFCLMNFQREKKSEAGERMSDYSCCDSSSTRHYKWIKSTYHSFINKELKSLTWSKRKQSIMDVLLLENINLWAVNSTPAKFLFIYLPNWDN